MRAAHCCHLLSSLPPSPPPPLPPQTLIGDCSFVASLAICADYERKFRERLITSIVFPQNRHGLPVMNPCGKYLVKLHINGCRRKVCRTVSGRGTVGGLTAA